MTIDLQNKNKTARLLIPKSIFHHLRRQPPLLVFTEAIKNVIIGAIIQRGTFQVRQKNENASGQTLRFADRSKKIEFSETREINLTILIAIFTRKVNIVNAPQHLANRTKILQVDDALLTFLCNPRVGLFDRLSDDFVELLAGKTSVLSVCMNKIDKILWKQTKLEKNFNLNLK